MTVDPGIAISVSDRFCCIFFYIHSAPHAFFAGIENQHVA